jgi:hypothetical protein
MILFCVLGCDERETVCLSQARKSVKEEVSESCVDGACRLQVSGSVRERCMRLSVISRINVD